MDHKTTLRVLGLAIVIVLVLGIGLFATYGGKSFVETLYEIFILVIGGLGAIALQMIVWPERFLPKSSQIPIQQMTIPTIEPAEKNLRSPSIARFKSEIRPNQQFFRRGDPVLFGVWFEGKLVNGYIAVHIKKPDGTFEGQPDWATVAYPSRGQGNLNGDHVITENHWSWAIPLDGPLGVYEFYIHVACFYPEQKSWKVRQKRRYLRWRNPHRTDLSFGHTTAVAGEWHTVEVVQN